MDYRCATPKSGTQLLVDVEHQKAAWESRVNKNQRGE